MIAKSTANINPQEPEKPISRRSQALAVCIDRMEALAHLAALGYTARESVYFTALFHGDNPKRDGDKGRAVNSPTSNIFWARLEAHQDEERNIHFVVNGQSRKKADIKLGRALFLEHDNLDKVIQAGFWSTLKLPQPTFQVDTGGKSIHSYWVLSEKVEISQWQKLQADLAEFADSDRALSNPNRCMRLAGSWYINAKGEKLAKAEIVTKTDARYSFEEIRALVPEAKKEYSRTWRKFEQETTIPIVESVPLELCLSRTYRALIEGGSPEGSRNRAATALARQLVATEQHLESIGQRFSGTAGDLLETYCNRCTPGYDLKEAEAILAWAEKQISDTALLPKQIEGCIKGWLYRETKGELDSDRYKFQSLGGSESNNSHGDRIAPGASPEVSPPQKQGKPDPIKKLLEIASEATYWHTPDEVAYVDVTIDGVRNTFPVKNYAFKRWLRHELEERHNISCGSDTLQTVLDTLDARAIFKGVERELYLRVAQWEDKIYLDLAREDWKVVEIDASGWRITDNCPVRFRRPKTMLPLPLPEEGGDLNELRHLLNLDEEQWVLVVSWLLNTLHPGEPELVPQPILILFGERAAGKSTTAKILKNLVDPAKSKFLPQVPNERDLAIAAMHRWVVAYDNLSTLSALESDRLCRLSTESGFSTKKLYEDDEEIVFEAKRPQILTGIDSLATRSDLLSRSILIQLPPLDPAKRMTESQLNRKLNEIKPRTLGALYTALSQALANKPFVNAPLERMADFMELALAAEAGLGFAPGTFTEAYQNNQSRATETVIDNSPFASAVIEFMRDRNNEMWEGSATELLKILVNYVSEADAKSKAFPSNAAWLTKRLIAVAPDLRKCGIDVAENKSNGKRSIVVKTQDWEHFLPSLPSYRHSEVGNADRESDTVSGGKNENSGGNENFTATDERQGLGSGGKNSNSGGNENFTATEQAITEQGFQPASGGKDGSGGKKGQQSWSNSTGNIPKYKVGDMVWNPTGKVDEVIKDCQINDSQEWIYSFIGRKYSLKEQNILPLSEKSIKNDSNGAKFTIGEVVRDRKTNEEVTVLSVVQNRTSYSYRVDGGKKLYSQSELSEITLDFGLL